MSYQIQVSTPATTLEAHYLHPYQHLRHVQQRIATLRAVAVLTLFHPFHISEKMRCHQSYQPHRNPDRGGK